jgi:hypothetical protein
MVTTTTKTTADDNGYDDYHNHNNQGKRFISMLKDVTDSKELEYHVGELHDGYLNHKLPYKNTTF